MKILMISSFYEPHVGGVEKHVKRVSQEIIKKGHNVTIYTLKYDSQLADCEIKDEVQIYRFSLMPLLQIWKWFFNKRRIIKEADAVYCHDFATFFYYLPFRFIYPRKHVCITFHGFEGIIPIPVSVRCKRKIAELLTNANICVGHYITKWYGTKADAVIYGGVDITESRGLLDIDITKRPIDALFVGRLEHDTGIMLYINALQILKDRFNKEIELHICGDGTLRDNIAQIAEKYGLSVELLGFVDPKPYLQKARFAFVSGYLAILEAMAEKCLVFSVYDNSLKEDYLRMMPCSNHMNISSDPEKLANTIAFYYDQTSLGTEKIKNAYQYAMEQRWDAIANIYLQLLKK